jgi:hypothetical protein
MNEAELSMLIDVPPDDSLQLESVRTFINEFGMSFADLTALDSALRRELFQSILSVRILVKEFGSLKSVLALEPKLRTELLDRIWVVNDFLHQIGLTFKQFLELKPILRKTFYEQASAIKKLISDFGMPLGDVLALDPALHDEVYRNPFTFEALVKEAQVPIKNLLALDPVVREKFLENTILVKNLAKNVGYSLKYLLALDSTQGKELILSCLTLNPAEAKRRIEVARLKNNSLVIADLHHTQIGFFKEIPAEIQVEILTYSRNPDIINVVDAKEIIDAAIVKIENIELDFGTYMIFLRKAPSSSWYLNLLDLTEDSGRCHLKLNTLDEINTVYHYLSGRMISELVNYIEGLGKDGMAMAQYLQKVGSTNQHKLK